jgi:hypothetical protein
MRQWVRVALPVLLVANLVALALYRGEPSYAGKSLSDWCVVLIDRGPELNQARAAVRRLGTNCPHTFVPVLAQCCRQGKRNMRRLALLVLLEHKEHAQAAVPVLINSLNDAVDRSDTNGVLHAEMIGVINAIDPEAAAKAGLK